MDEIRRLRDAVEQLSIIGNVDCSYLQGRDSILQQLQKRSGQNEEGLVDGFVTNAKKAVSDLVRSVSSQYVPEEYIYFLEYYGGFSIAKDSHYFQILGIGPMVEEWYAAIDSDAAIVKPGEHGLLSIGSLSFAVGKYKFKRVSFLLDLVGKFQVHSVIGIGPWGKEVLTPLDVINDYSSHRDMWKIVANSFTQWLEQAGKTDGLFTYG